jgi:DNA-binding NtrC family response regulator
VSTNDTSILIVDDDENVRSLLEELLAPHYSCFTAENAKEAVTHLGRQHFNLLITDVKLPGASGIKLCQLIKELIPQTAVVVISGHGDDRQALEAMQCGAFMYVKKPFDLARMALTVEYALRHQSAVAAKRAVPRGLNQVVVASTNT